jgi:cytochrome c
MRDKKHDQTPQYTRRICLKVVACLALSTAFAPAADDYDPGRFEREIIVPACHDPMQCEITADGRVFFIERGGALKLVKPVTRQVILLGHRDVHLTGEVGMLGLALDRDFEKSQSLFLFFSPKEKKGTLRLARFNLRGDKLDLDSEKILFDYKLEHPGLQHQGGGLFMAANGDLLIGTGDNTSTIPEIQIDERPGKQTHDAQRTSANSMDLRGKVLRVRPTADGGYSIPPGNLFPDGKIGRAEIFAMGVRNAFRLSADAKSGFIYWGDVGQNIDESIGAGPNGYDEVNQARGAGNFGWPHFTGSNEPYRKFDFVTRQAGTFFDVNAPVNTSPNNTGARALPRPQPAFIWYPSGPSREFPTLGSGGRSAMAGPVNHFDSAVTNDLKLPRHFDHTLFIYDWMRNWIQIARLDAKERLAGLEPFLPGMRFRKPVELKLAPDHTLYVIEYGDKWGGNTDAQIVRLIYRRGNRAPVAVASADTLAGKAPLKVRFDARGSSDKDGHALSFAWSFGTNGALGVSRDVTPEFVFENAGEHPVTLNVTDKEGAQATTRLEIRAGNAPPQVFIEAPATGSFYDPKQSFTYRLAVRDDEDGDSEDGLIPPGRVLLEAKATPRAARAVENEAALHPGFKLMRATTCFACHITTDTNVGPPYVEVSRKYRRDEIARERLAQRIITGGVGVWGQEVPMPPHPQHTLEETRQMADWILSLADLDAPPPQAGFTGTLTAPEFNRERRASPPVFALTASYIDNGASGQPQLRGERVAILHPRRKKAASFDDARGAEVVDVFEGEEFLVARLADGGWVKFDTVNLTGIQSLSLRLGGVAKSVSLEVRADSAQGLLLARAPLLKPGADFRELTVPVRDPGGIHDLVFIVRGESPESPAVLDLNWVQFNAGGSEE